jgi:type 1 fimbriae regulatory protein FimB/type 1 fimbriae regulatory protein FimE
MSAISLISENGTSRKYLTSDELESVFKACKNPRDKALCKLSFNHALRCTEALNLTWSDVDFTNRQLHIKRAKGGDSSSHPLEAHELRYLRSMQRKAKTAYVFESNRKQPLSARTVRKLFKTLEVATGIAGLHHHQLRHSCGYHMADHEIPVLTIQRFMGHKSIENTMIYVKAAGKDLDKLRNWYFN